MELELTSKTVYWSALVAVSFIVAGLAWYAGVWKAALAALAIGLLSVIALIVGL